MDNCPHCGKYLHEVKQATPEVMEEFNHLVKEYKQKGMNEMDAMTKAATKFPGYNII